MQVPLDPVYINDDITNRPYQKEAILSVCEAIRQKQRKHYLLWQPEVGRRGYQFLLLMF